MRFAYYDKLSPARQRIYRKSDAIATLGLPAGLEPGLWSSDRRWLARTRQAVQSACQGSRCVDGRLSRSGGAGSGARTRPADDYGELHGSTSRRTKASWRASTCGCARRRRSRSWRSRPFCARVIHELCHHLDYDLFALEETLHTEGFYKRESSLAKALLAQLPSPTNRQPRSSAQLLRGGHSLRCALRDRCRVPAAADRLDQPDAGGEPATDDRPARSARC